MLALPDAGARPRAARGQRARRRGAPRRRPRAAGARIGRDARTRGRLRALNLTCTHLGCRVTATEAGFTCPCHGSRFDENGAVLTGPATRALHELVCFEDGDRITVRLPEAT
ncbi:MAG: Rieske 2Fe-2S domain-containing protein [bacterium]|nr:Rieske 2Fe-2S domain-containing protein [bacterium]